MIDDTKINYLKSPSFEQALKFASDLNQLNDANKTDEKISISYGKFLKVIEANQAALDKPENKDKLRDIATAMTTLANRRIQLKESNWFFIHTFFHKLISLFKGHGFQTKAAYGLHLAQTLRDKALSETPQKVEELKVPQESKTPPQDPIVKNEAQKDANPSGSQIKREEPFKIPEQAEEEKEIRDQPLNQIPKEELPKSSDIAKETEPNQSVNEPRSEIPKQVEEVKAKAPLSTEKAETVPALLTFGLFREGKNQGAPSDLFQFADPDKIEDGSPSKGSIGMGIDTYKIHAAALATCFHTNENEKEITDLIQKMREKCDPFSRFHPGRSYIESKITWYNNIVHLHDAFPGKSTKKEAKIYWTKEVETILFPLFFLNEKVNIDDLVFAVVPGQEKESPYHADKMNYQEQLQFIGIGKAKYLGENYKNEPALDENPLMSDAKRYTALHSKKADLPKS